MTKRVEIVGSRVRVEFGHDPKAKKDLLDCQYHVETQGLSDAEILAEIDRIQTHHEKKSARIIGFAPLIGTALAVGNSSYRITDCSIRERVRDAELYVAAVNGAEDSTVLVRVYPTVDDVSDNAGIVAALADQIAHRQRADGDNAATMARLKKLLGV